MLSEIEQRFDTLTDMGASWVYHETRLIDLKITTFNNIGGSNFIKSPLWIAKLKEQLTYKIKMMNVLNMLLQQLFINIKLKEIEKKLININNI